MTSYQKSLDFIYHLRGAEIDLRLERVLQALSLFDHPQDRFRVCHVAGTNGKGSTAAMIHSVLSAGRYRAGLYTSPHLVDFTERIRIGKRRITRAAVTALVREIAERTRQASLCLTFFEFATVMAFLHFARERVEVAVVEVGLGGRLDATNVVHPDVCVITTIARDHERFPRRPDRLHRAGKRRHHQTRGPPGLRRPAPRGPTRRTADRTLARSRGLPVGQGFHRHAP